MSSGYLGFFAHAGFLQSLERASLFPAAVAGTSSGGLAAAAYAAGLNGAEMAKAFCSVRRNDFWDPAPGTTLRTTVAGVGGTGLLRGDKFRRLVQRTLPVDAFHQCRLPLLLVVTQVDDGNPHPVTSGRLSTAVHATCAYPGLFCATQLFGRYCWDGGLADKAPALALADHSTAGELDAVLVHMLPSHRTRPPRGPWAYVQGMARSMTALRQQHFLLQLEVLRQRGVPVYIVSSSLPELTLGQLHQGAEVVSLAMGFAQTALNAPPVPYRPHTLHGPVAVRG